MEKGANLSEDKMYRYTLWRIWDNTLPKILFVMLNPSTADADEDDHTIIRCIGFAKSWGFGGLYVVNLYAFRTKDPKILKLEQNTFSVTNVRGPNNKEHILKAKSLTQETIFAWGSSDPAPYRYKGPVLNWLISQFPTAKCLGKTKTGNPKHPLYLKADTTPVLFSPITNNKKE